MKYMLIIYGNHDAWNTLTRQGWKDLERVHQSIQAELSATGELVDTHPLSVENAKVVRTRSGVPAVTDGPFVEAKEVLGGYYLVDCANLDRAVDIASRFTEAEFAPIEVRQVGAG